MWGLLVTWLALLFGCLLCVYGWLWLRVGVGVVAALFVLSAFVDFVCLFSLLAALWFDCCVIVGFGVLMV